MISKSTILAAHSRINPFIKKTPILSSKELNNMLGHEVIFKAESVQVTGSFKVRGVLNAFLSLVEQNKTPKKLVAYSSGNHAKAIAWLGSEVAKIPTEIYMHESASKSKQEITKELGAELIITKTRNEAEKQAKAKGMEPGCYFLHPSDNDLVIAGAATLTYEALQEIDQPLDAVFAGCGGGALLSGTYLGITHSNHSCKIFAAEPRIANDASRSYKLGKIVGFDESPATIADGLRTLKVSERTFKYLQKLNGFIEASEEDILYWSVWLNNLLPVPCEPTAATAMASAFRWLKQQKSKQRVMVILSGGNIDQEILDLLQNSNNLDLRAFLA
jgi:threonine dehydratase